MILLSTGRLVVPDVYNMKPPFPEVAPFTSTGPLALDPSSMFLVIVSTGLCSKPVCNTSSALSLNLGVESRILASLFSRRYRSSLAGKECERGRAMASWARMAKNVTVRALEEFRQHTSDTHQHNCSCFLQGTLFALPAMKSHVQSARYGPSQRQHLEASCHRRMTAGRRHER